MGSTADRSPHEITGLLARLACGEQLREVVGVDDSQLEAIYAWGYAALGAGRTEDARRALAMLVALEPSRARAWLALGLLLERSGDRREAAAFYAVGAAIDDSAIWWLRSAECAASVGNRSGTRRAARSALCGRGVTELIRQRANLLMEEVCDDDPR